jgi:2-dehydro-3-deoxyphosphogalactonate aldolase
MPPSHASGPVRTEAATAFDEAFAACPLIAILRGLTPEEAEDVGEALVAAGISILEVPLNSPRPLESIRKLAIRLAGRAVVGAGTVYRVPDVDAVAEAGGRIIVSPNANPAVIARSKALGLVSAPGVMTPTEAWTALEAGADVLKLFPGEMIAPAVVRAMAAVLPKGTRLVLVGGVGTGNMTDYAGTPIAGFGIGSALFKPGFDAATVGQKARAFMAAFRESGITAP